jgi:hypothetical protein
LPLAIQQLLLGWRILILRKGRLSKSDLIIASFTILKALLAVSNEASLVTGSVKFMKMHRKRRVAGLI